MAHLRYYVFILMTIMSFCGFAETLPDPLLESVSIDIECEPKVSIDDNFYVYYKLKYSNPSVSDYNLKPEISKEDNKHAKLINFSLTHQSSSFKTIGGNVLQSKELTWTAIFKPLKKGKFITPVCQVTAVETLGAKRSFPINIAQESKTIQIVDSDKVSGFQNNEAKQEAKKLAKSEPVFLHIELPKGEFIVGEPIIAKLYVLIKNLDIRFDVEDAVLDTKVKIKNADFRFIQVNDASITGIDYNGKTYRGALVELIEITPLKAGEITIPKLTLKGTGHLFENSPFWGNVPGEKFNFTYHSSPVTFRVSEKKNSPLRNSDGRWL